VYDLVYIDLVVVLLVMLDECSRRWRGCLPDAVLFMSRSTWVRGRGSGGDGGGLYSPSTVSLGGGSTASRYEHATLCPLGLLTCSSSCSMRAVGDRGCLPCAKAVQLRLYYFFSRIVM
jgi:hypothetical protein